MSTTHTAKSIAKTLHATLDGKGELVCTGVSAIDDAVAGDITFMVSNKYARKWEHSKATIGIVRKSLEVPNHNPDVRAILRVEDAELAIATVLGLFSESPDLPVKGIHATAVISPSATIGQGVSIGPHVVISDDVTIGDDVVICNSTYIGKSVSIGRGTTLRTNVVIEQRCVVGEDSYLNANVVIGADGFGFRPDLKLGRLIKMPHIGNVVIGNRVEIGANSCIDRGKFSSTSIGDGTKMDNLIQVGHNVKIGANCVIASLVGIGGSVRIGDWVQIGAQVGIAPQFTVGDGAKIGAKSGLMHDMPPGEEWLGVPAGPVKDTLRQWAITRKMPQIARQLGNQKDQ